MLRSYLAGIFMFDVLIWCIGQIRQENELADQYSGALV